MAGVTTDDGFPLLFGLVWVASALAFFAICQLPNGLEHKDLGTSACRRPLKAGLSSRISRVRAKPER